MLRMIKIAQVSGCRMGGEIQFGGVLDDQYGGLEAHARQGALLMGGADSRWRDALGIQEAIGALGCRPGTTGFGNAGGRMCSQVIDEAEQPLAQADILKINRVQFGCGPYSHGVIL